MELHYTKFGHVDAIKVGLKNDSQQPEGAVITVGVVHKIPGSTDEKRGEGTTRVSLDPLAEKNESLPLETSILIKGNRTSYTIAIETP